MNLFFQKLILGALLIIAILIASLIFVVIRELVVGLLLFTAILMFQTKTSTNS